MWLFVIALSIIYVMYFFIVYLADILVTPQAKFRKLKVFLYLRLHFLTLHVYVISFLEGIIDMKWCIVCILCCMSLIGQ
jgi:hypothetical protein